ncbi:hypothetical protein DFP73DRAFT_593276 [Morchella snyderi]|nr:hypothetical protein DFP73DRAFT_593276 [Morchella snyderi]
MVTLLLIGVIHQNNTLTSAVSKLAADLASLREEIAAPKAAPAPTSDPLIIQKLDALIGKASAPTPTPHVPHRPTPPAKPTQPRAPPTHAQVVRATPNPPKAPTKKAAKATAAKAPGSSPKEKAMPTAHRRFFATRTTPGPIANAERLSAALPRLFGQALAQSHQVAPVTSLSVTINNRGTVSVTAPPTVPSSVYTPFFEALTTILNVEVASPENPAPDAATSCGKHPPPPNAETALN